jgi:hypothetical protein
MGEPMTPASKRCSKCGELKTLGSFNRNARYGDGRRPECRACQKQAADRYCSENREKINERNRRRRDDNHERELERERKYREETRERRREVGREWARRNMGQQVEYQRHRTAELAARVFGHYGEACACCGSAQRLTIDHIDGLGREHREELFGSNKAAGRTFYLWLIRNDLPEGYQTLCARCNTSKRRGPRCKIAHRNLRTQRAA